jgi:PEP-CTERM motif
LNLQIYSPNPKRLWNESLIQITVRSPRNHLQITHKSPLVHCHRKPINAHSARFMAGFGLGREISNSKTRRTTMKNLKYNLLALAVLALAITPSFGGTAPITDLYSTGQFNNNFDQGDAHYTILPGSPSGQTTAYTVDPYNILCCWATPPAGTWWINPYHAEPGGQPNGNAAAGLYIYQTTFTLAPGWTNASLSGQWAVDNSATMLLNGNLVATTGIGPLTPFTATNQSWFQTGTNTLTFDVTNNGCQEGCGFNPTGLLVQISGTVSPTPEPSSLLLMGSGLLGLAAVVRRKLMG